MIAYDKQFIFRKHLCDVFSNLERSEFNPHIFVNKTSDLSKSYYNIAYYNLLFIKPLLYTLFC